MKPPLTLDDLHRRLVTLERTVWIHRELTEAAIKRIELNYDKFTSREDPSE